MSSTASQSQAQQAAPDQLLAVIYHKRTDAYRLLNEPLKPPQPRIERGDPHRTRPQPKERLKQSFQAYLLLQHERPFEYTKVQKGQIRLISLHKADPKKPLRASMFIRKLEDVYGGFEALSYCWGSPTERATEEISVRNLNATLSDFEKNVHTEKASDKWRITARAVSSTLSSPFHIRKNLHEALRRLRSQADDVTLWVDAICIDQTDRGKQEKEEQLAMMAQIYNSASNVCIWLGDTLEVTRPAMQLVRDITNLQIFDSLIASPAAKNKWISLINLMKAPWFTRRWIIQEVALSRNATIHCGEEFVHWDDFADAVSLLAEKAEILRSKFREEIFDDLETANACTLIQFLTNVRHTPDDQKDLVDLNLLDLETLVSTLLAFQATSPRDTIYSILSLARDKPGQHEQWEKLHFCQLQHNIEVEEHDVKLSITELEHEKEKLNTRKDQLAGTKSQLITNEKSLQLNNEKLDAQKLDASKALIVQDLEKNGKEVMENAMNIASNTRSLKRKVKELVELQKVERPKKGIGLTPNYALSTRDLFVAFITRCVDKSGCLDIICRHWAPRILDDLNFAEVDMPSWISGMSRAPYGVPGTSQGRQNGENFVAYSPRDQRKRYDASGSYKADFRLRICTGNTLDQEGPHFYDDVITASPKQMPVQISRSKLVPIVEEPSSFDLNNVAEAATAGSERGSLPQSDGQTQNPPLSAARSPSLPRQPIRTHALRGMIPTRRPSRSSTTTLKKEDVERKIELSGVLAVRGFQIGTIKDHSDVIRGGVVPGDWLRKMGWDIEKNKNRVPDILWRLLVADRDEGGNKPPQWYKRACLHGLVDPKVADDDGNIHTEQPADRPISENTTKYFDRVKAVVWNRRLIEIEGNIDFKNGVPLFGLAPKESRPKDVVCVLLGCSVPVIMRMVILAGSSEHVYQVMGEAYIHGMMDGQAVQDANKVNRLKTEFTLI